MKKSLENWLVDEINRFAANVSDEVFVAYINVKMDSSKVIKADKEFLKRFQKGELTSFEGKLYRFTEKINCLNNNTFMLFERITVESNEWGR